MTDWKALCAALVDEAPYESPTTCLARAALAQSEPDQDDKILRSIRETTPRYRISVIVSTNDSAIDTRMNVIWQALDLSKEILESVSLPEQLPPLGKQ